MAFRLLSWKWLLVAHFFSLVGIAAATEKPSDGTGYEQQAERIADRVHVLHQGPGFHVQVIGNVTIVEQKDGVVLIDSGGTPGAGRRVVALVRKISAKPVKAIVITHWHGDHHFGLSEVLRAWPQAMVIATEATSSHINNRGLPAKPDPAYDAGQIKKFEQTRADLIESSRAADTPATQREQWKRLSREVGEYENDFRGPQIRFATVTFSDRIALPDDVAPIEILFLGKANTDGDAVAWLPKQRIFVSGDIVVSPVAFGGGSYPAEWKKVIDNIAAYDFDILVPGHGLPQHDKKYLSALGAALDDVATQARTFVAQGVSIEDAQEKMNFSKQRELLVQNDPWLLQWLEADWEPIAICAFQEAKGISIVQGKSCRP